MGSKSSRNSSVGTDPDREGLAIQQMNERQSQILKPTKGARMASARIRRGDILEWYSFESKLLGTGFSGPVRLGVSKRSGRKYAVKPFSKIGANKDKVNMLRNEASVYLRLDHPHIARLIEIWESPQYVYIVMEYCSGGELFDRLCARKVYSESAARHVTLQMFSAISYLHNSKIVHRDLKLENFLYENSEHNSNLKLIDFGFAKIWDSKHSKRMHATCGTLAYVSPDTLLGSYTNTCDIWSLGVIVYMLLVGYPPFYGTEEDMFSRILDAQYSLLGPRWDRVSPLAKQFIRRLLVKDGTKRMTAQEALQHPWLAYEEPPQVLTLGPTVVESLRRFAQRNKFQRAALTLIAYSMTSSQVEDIRHTFLCLDRSKEGTIRSDELEKILHEELPEITTDEVKKIFKALAGVAGENDRIHFNDFLAAMLTYRLPIDEELLRQCFLKFDAECCGFISFQNVSDTLGDDRYTEAKLRRMFAEADEDENGLIDYEEFSRLVIADNEEDIQTFFAPQIQSHIATHREFSERPIASLSSASLVKNIQSGQTRSSRSSAKSETRFSENVEVIGTSR